MNQKTKKARVIKQIIFFLSTALLLIILTPSFSTNYQEALTAVEKNDLAKAQTLLHQTLSRNPNDINSKTLYAIVTYRQGNYEAAETQLLELSTKDQLSKNDSILYMLADVQNTLGLKQEALNTIITAYEVNPENLSIQQLYTSIYYDLSDEYKTVSTASAAPVTASTYASQPNISIQAVQQLATNLISTRSMNTASATDSVETIAKTDSIQNALYAATQGTTLIPESTVTSESLTDSTIVSSTLEAATEQQVTALDRPYTFEEASQSFAEKKFNLARVQLENVLAGNPYHLEATKMLAQLAYRDGNLEQSVELYQRIIQTADFIQDPQAEVHYGLALAQRSLGDIEGAFNNATQAILQTPDDEAINKLYDNLSSELAQNDNTLPEAVSYTFADALASYKENDIETARMQLQSIVSNEPNNKEAITMLAYIIYRDGNSEQAEAMFQSLVSQADFDENSDILYGLALAQRNNGKVTDALATIQRAQVAAPNREDVSNLLAKLSDAVQAERTRALQEAAASQNQKPKLDFSFEDALEAYKANDIETAQARFEALVANNPDDTDSAILLAYIIYRSDSDRAVQMFTAITEKADFNENSDVLYGLALSHRNSGNLELAFTSIERAYIAAPEREDVADLYTNLAAALEEAQASAQQEQTQETASAETTETEANAETTETIDLAAIANEEAPKSSLSYTFEDALNAYKANDIETAKTQFEGLVNENPDDTDSATLLAYIVYRSDAALAASMFQNIVDRVDFNENSDVLYGLALSQRNAGDLDAAFKSIARAYTAAPERDDVKELYAQLYTAVNSVADGS